MSTLEPSAQSARPADRPADDAIARSQRVLALVDDYLDKPSSDARLAIRVELMREFEQSDAARIAAHKAQAAVLESLRDQAALHRMALVPLRMTRAMRDVVDTEGWDWPDLLAAAEAVSENDHQLAGMNHTAALEKAVDDFIEDYVLEQDGGAYVPTEKERFLLKDAMVGLFASPGFDAVLHTVAGSPYAPENSDDGQGNSAEQAPTTR